jgi:hypothetical protein
MEIGFGQPSFCCRQLSITQPLINYPQSMSIPMLAGWSSRPPSSQLVDWLSDAAGFPFVEGLGIDKRTTKTFETSPGHWFVRRQK